MLIIVKGPGVIVVKEANNPGVLCIHSFQKVHSPNGENKIQVVRYVNTSSLTNQMYCCQEGYIKALQMLVSVTFHFHNYTRSHK